MSSLRRRLAELSPQPQTLPSIYKVPQHLGDVNNKAYEPEMVAIGPYHHGKLKYKRTEELKLRYFDSLLHRKDEIKVDCYISAIKEITKRARDCYAEPSINLDDDEFTDMLVLDGCFIIGVMLSPKLYETKFPARASRRMLQWDLILLENQIPFFVLCKLFDLIQGPEQHRLLIERVLVFCDDVFPGKVMWRDTTLRSSSEEIKHILDLNYWKWCPPHQTRPNRRTKSGLRVIPSASELKDANIKFRNKKYDWVGSRLTSLFDVDFKNCGQMLMPTLEVHDVTERLLRNLIAYEQLFPDNVTTYVTDYAALLDYLINTSKDVQILCRAKIIENMLGSDKAVAEIVNRLTDNIMVSGEDSVYAGTFRDINDHYKRGWNRAVAAFHRDYFSSPWAYIAFLGALLLLLLSIAQTVFSALQVFNKPADQSESHR